MEPQKNTVEESANSSDGETTVEPRRKVVEESASSSDSEKTMDPRRNIVEESANSSHRAGKENLLKRNLHVLKHESGDSSAFSQKLTSNKKSKSKGATLETLDENLPSQCFEDRKTPSPKELNISYHTPSSDFEDNFSAMEENIRKGRPNMSRNPLIAKERKAECVLKMVSLKRRFYSCCQFIHRKREFIADCFLKECTWFNNFKCNVHTLL
ncbi:hypothetical protein TNIN_148031 [Trichonephila inaurata madagascariensis]|uniref:Uncharacterized protein n=1 Tax=Trichonephila inaurata madagascariensis TaxID=2747483 RepID=A0A8X6XME2_9ARAC|nr:hypothetical protein TNIN_148031 [Trichonephila inaurata madagascariensis]